MTDADLPAIARHMGALDDVINDPAAIVYVRDTAGRYVWVSDSYAENLPFTREQVLGRTNRDLYGVDAARVWDVADALTRATTDFMVICEDMYDARPGSRHWRKFVSTKLMLTIAGTPYLVGISVEIRDTAAQRYEQHLGQLRARLIERMGPVNGD
jgi:PAS domain-containing protein